MNMKDKILDKALELLNNKGIDNISTYDIAKALKIRQSNLTYYFPTKREMTNAIVKRMVEEVNSNLQSIVISPDTFSIKTYYDLVDGAMQVHQKYKFLFMNYANIITSDKELNKFFKDILSNARIQEFENIIKLLQKNGYLINDNLILEYNKANMYAGNILAIYWIQESAIYHADKSEKEQREHHLKVFFQTYVPYLTRKGKVQLNKLIK